MPEALYLDTSAALRAIIETGTTPEFERRIRGAGALLTSRLALVEGARVLLRMRVQARVSEQAMADAGRNLDSLWARCEVWELTPAVCDAACHVAPARALRALDALHLATYVLARRKVPDLELLTADQRLQEAAASV